ncbi:tetratricopeptide repeat protein [Acidomonas methanolica]|uniref:tetratricopeptide repeat protein n=1 Tax=Acidomonas methanolica TaxID=437 RepID=UPI00211A60DC|nr:tetratricopeptide repeat protein [Acidomonas methanolica]MCQ9155425.1 tetratricopeptide repeat protein [Acidomonas methanolica]
MMRTKSFPLPDLSRKEARPFIALGAAVLAWFPLPLRAEAPISLSGAFLAAVVAVHRHDLAMADQACGLAVQAGMTDPAFIQMAERLAASDEGDEAVARALSLARKLPFAPLSHLLLGDEAMRNKNWADALALFSAKGNGDFVSTAVPVQRAWALIGDGKATDALAALHDGDARDLLAPLGLLQAARIKARIDLTKAAPLFARVQASRNGLPPLLDFLVARPIADWKAAQGDPAGAKDVLAGLAALHPALAPVAARMTPDPDAARAPDPRRALADFYTGLALLLGSAQPPDQAHQEELRQAQLVLLRQAIWLAANAPRETAPAVVAIADVLESDKQYRAARSVLRMIGGDDPFRPLADRIEAQIALRQKDYAAALDALRRVTKLTPDDAAAQATLGDVLEAQNRDAEAVTAYDIAIADGAHRSEPLWSLLLSRAVALDHLDRRAAARADLERALKLAPQEPILLNYIGYSGVEHGDHPDESLDLLHRAMTLAPGDAAIRDSYAWGILKLRGDAKAALPLLTSAAEGAPDDAEIAYHLGVAYWLTGRHLEARDQWNQALGDTPEPDLRRQIETALVHGPDLALPTTSPHMTP